MTDVTKCMGDLQDRQTYHTGCQNRTTRYYSHEPYRCLVFKSGIKRHLLKHRVTKCCNACDNWLVVVVYGHLMKMVDTPSQSGSFAKIWEEAILHINWSTNRYFNCQVAFEYGDLNRHVIIFCGQRQFNKVGTSILSTKLVIAVAVIRKYDSTLYCFVDNQYYQICIETLDMHFTYI